MGFRNLAEVLSLGVLNGKLGTHRKSKCSHGSHLASRDARLPVLLLMACLRQPICTETQGNDAGVHTKWPDALLVRVSLGVILDDSSH